jgi:hypothetical protein
MKDKKTIINILILLAVLVVVVLLFSLGSKNKPVDKTDGEVLSATQDNAECYSYNHEATGDEPYTVSEFVKLNFDGTSVTGVKTGTQTGPDMTNGYSGTLDGTIENNTIDVVYSYVIEGTNGLEKEIYRVREDKTGIEKLRYPLIEGKDMLIPDLDGELKVSLYSRVPCEGSN